MDFESIHKKAEETHRQFYERLLQHSKQHLAPANVKADNLRNGASGDKMTISLMNMVALQWLRKTNPDLIAIIKTEYSTELRSNTQLADLVPRIAPNIDSLLRRYEQGSSSNKVSLLDSGPMAMDTAAINKTWGRDNPGVPAQGRRGGGTAGRGAGPAGRSGASLVSRSPGSFCPGCFYLSQQLKTNIHFRHSPGDCPRKSVIVKMFQMEDQVHFDV